MNNSIRYSKFWRLASFAGVLLFCLYPRRIDSSCVPNPNAFSGYSFIDSDLTRRYINMAPLLPDFPKLYELYKGQVYRQTEDNVKEWRERVCSLATEADIHYLVYIASVGELEDLRTAVSSKRIPLSYLGASIADNSFARFIYRNRCTEIVDYLIFAKQCEPYAVKPGGWEKPALARESMQRLIQQGKQEFMRTQSHYVRLRYAYQIIRLAHYAKLYEDVLALYDYLMPKIDHDPSIIEYWILGHKAGALLALDRRVEAAYLYSRVFDRCPSKRESAFLSFRIRSDEEWRQCLLLCQSDRERAALYALRAHAEDSRLVEEMEKIYEYDPRSEFLEVLLVRELAQLEKDLLGYDFNDKKAVNKRYHDRPRANAGRLVIDLQSFVRKALKEGEIESPALWKIAEGYLELLAGNFYFAEKTFKAAREMVDNDTLERQLDAFEAALRISALPALSPEVEATAADTRTSEVFAQYPDFPEFLNDKMAYLYENGGRPGLAFISRHSLRDLRANPQLNIIDDLLEVCRKEKRSRWEKWLVEKPDGTTREKELIDLKATLLLSDYQLEAALEVFKQMDRAEWDDYGVFNPYADRIRDCVRCPLPDTLALYSKGEMIENLMQTEYQAKAATDPDEAARLFHRLGVAFYNLSYYGYSWRAADNFRSGASAKRYKRGSRNYVFSNPLFALGNKENMDVTQALYYFEKARMLAKDRELGARATFWAAKCEQKLHYLNNAAGVKPAREYFAILKRYYNDTDYAQRVIRECKYYKSFAAQ